MGSVTGGLSHKKGASHKATKVARRFCRICVDGSSEKPGEYADVSAHVAQLGTFKAQVGSAAELEGTIYSGDWTQAHLCALNTAPQYMAAPRAILPKHTPNGERMCLRLSIHKALYGGSASAGLWGACCDTWLAHQLRLSAISRWPFCLYMLTQGTARIAMVLATDDTISTSVPHEKYFPGSQVLHDKYVAALIADFERADGSVGFTAKGKAKEFIGVGIDQTSPCWSHRSRHACYCQ
jgi:hypothetical protein